LGEGRVEVNVLLDTRAKKIKLADAVIAPTALVNNLSLVTTNMRDFKGIRDLQIINPLR